jgi:hypothetical protein
MHSLSDAKKISEYVLKKGVGIMDNEKISLTEKDLKKLLKGK